MPQTKKAASKSRKKDASFKKAPGAPKRFKSSYIHFFMHVHDNVKKLLPPEEATAPNVSKKASEMWKSLPISERKHWDDLAESEKNRYLEQKKNYKGPWKVPNKRAKKDPSAPKRNPSAFLLYSSTRRQVLQREHPHLDNTSISRILGHEWRTMAPGAKRYYVEREQAERASYKEQTIQWKREKELKKVGEESLHFEAPYAFQDNAKEEKGETGCEDNVRSDVLHNTLPENDASPKKIIMDDTPIPLRSRFHKLEGGTEAGWEGKAFDPHRDLKSCEMLSNTSDFLSESFNPQQPGIYANGTPLHSNDAKSLLNSLENKTMSNHAYAPPNVPKRNHPYNPSVRNFTGAIYPYQTGGYAQNAPPISQHHNLEGAFRRLDETSPRFNGLNRERDLSGELKRPDVRYNRHLDVMTSLCHPSTKDPILENESPCLDNDLRELFHRLNESLSSKNQECRRKFDSSSDSTLHKTGASDALNFLTESDHSFQRRLSLSLFPDEDLEEILKERLGRK